MSSALRGLSSLVAAWRSIPYQLTHAASRESVQAAMSAYCPPMQKPVIPIRRPAVSGRPAR